jgi:hypothetical protein
MIEITPEFRAIAYEFIQAKLAFFDREWRDKLAKELALLIEKTVKAHTSAVSNTALRDALAHNERMAAHALAFLPFSAKQCRCIELDDGEHRPQPICHYCAINAIGNRASHELKQIEDLEKRKTA